MAHRADRNQPHRNVFVKPEPITKKGIQTYNRQTLYIYEGKKGPITFEPHRQKSAGTALGSIFKKTTDTSANPKEWMGKVGEPSGLLQDDPASVRTITRKEINISVTQEKVAADLYKELGRGMFDVPKTRLSSLPVLDHFTRGHALAHEWLRQGVVDTLRVMSRFVDGYQDFTQARTREGGRDYSFMEYIEEHHRPPDFLITEEGVLVPLKGLIELLAVGRIVADTDMIGGGGGNAGFKWIYGDNGTIVGAQTVKIDPGYAFQFKTPVNWLFNKLQNNQDSKLGDTRDIQIANNYQGVTIKWESMAPEQRDAFLSSLQNCGRYLSEEVLSFLFYREGRFQDMPALIAQKMTADFKEWVALQFQIFGEEISTFKRENPLHQLRIQYIDKWGELPLLLSEENVLISEFFTPLIIKEHREIEEEQADHTGGLGASLHSAKTIKPHQLFVEKRHVLLCGPPGVGKSTFSQELTHRWASGKLFNDRFHAVYWIPLRKLNKELEPGGFLHGVVDPDQFLARTIANILLEDQSLTDACLAEIKNNREKTLLILDGYDEATIPLSRALLSVFSDRELSILLTSRAGFTDRISTYIDQTIENSGFTDDGIRIYATRFFTRRQASPLTQKRADDFLKAIKKTPDFFEISHNPLQLQILCSLWESGSGQRGFPAGITGLYQSMIEQFFRWEYHRREQDVRSVSGTTKQSLFSTLGLIAQRGLADSKLIIPELDITAWLEGGEWGERDLLETGLLKLSGSGANICYHFQHQTFQEYLAAYWISTRPQEEQEAFIQTYRDHPRYRVVIPFLAGITYQRDATPSKEVTKRFFQALCQNVVLKHKSSNQELVQLIIKSINECPGYTGTLPSVEALFQAHPSLLETEVEVQEITEVPLHTAIRLGQIHFLKWFVTRQGRGGLKKTTSSGLTPMHAAALNGDVEMMQWLHERDPELVGKADEDGKTPMHFAAMLGRLEAMQWLHERDPEFLHVPEDNGYTPMHIAALEGQLEAMQWLHEKDPELFRKPTNNGASPMHLATHNGHLGAMQWLYNKDPELFRKPTNNGWTLMHSAAQSGHLEAMQWLHDKDPELVRKPTNNGWTPMHSAAQNGHLEAMQWLHDRDPELFSKPTNNGWTPMHSAAQNGHLEAMQWLHDRDPELFSKADKYGSTTMHSAAANGHLEVMRWLHDRDPELFCKPTNSGRTPMHDATSNGKLEAMQWLYDKNPKLVRKADNDGWTLMHTTALRGKLEAMQWLHDKDPELFSKADKYGSTPMHIAASNGKLEAMQWLYEKDPELVRKADNNGWTPMRVAASNGKLEAMQWLYEKDPELVRKADNNGWTPMRVAADEGNLQAMQWLHEKDPELFRKPDKYGKTPMHIAASNGKLEAMQWLHEKDPELFRKPDKYGKTPMHIAASNGKLEAMQWLHEKDPELFRKPDKYGKTPMHIAANEGNLQAMQWLHEKDPELIRKADNNGGTPMHDATSNGKLEAMQWLHEKDPELIRKADNNGCTPMHDATSNGKLEAMQWLHEKDPELVRKVDCHARTPMHVAADEGNLQAMQWLHEKDPELVCKADNNGCTPMRNAIEGNQPEVMQWLHEKDPELFRTTNQFDTYMHVAAEAGNLQAMQWLHDKDPELVRQAGRGDCTPMHVAAKAGNLQAMQWLHEKAPELVHRADKNGDTPMNSAASRGRLKAMQWLHSKDPELFRNANKDGRTLMHAAALNGKLKAMQWLHEEDPELIRKADNNGWTPMHNVVFSENLKAMQWLHTKDPELVYKADKRGDTPIKIAALLKHQETVQWLNEKDREGSR